MDSIVAQVVAINQELLKPEAVPFGWHYAAPEGLTARVDGYSDGIICRIGAGEDKEVVQLGIGEATSYLCNAIYSPSADKAVHFHAEGLLIEQSGEGFALSCSGPLTITVRDGYMRTHRSLPWFTPLDRTAFPRPPAGWCSWYDYYLDITEEEIVKNTDWLADNLQRFGCDWVQIDDGWQGRGGGFGTNRDWFVTCERDFPHGMKWIADYIRGKGFRPGIWCIPFTQSNEQMYQENAALFLHKPDGSSVGELETPGKDEWMSEDERRFDWAGRYVIDTTGEEGKSYISRLFQLLCHEWDYDYVKIDGQWNIGAMYRTYRAQQKDPSVEWSRAVRSGQSIMKSVMGEDKYLLNCGLGFESCGICDGIRTGGDVQLSWEGMRAATSATLAWHYLNTIAFYTDPDVVCAREPLTLDLARFWTVLVGITGQMFMASDKMYELPEERVELLRRVYPVADIHPMELYPLNTHIGERPGIFDLKVRLPEVGDWDVVALFNWEESEVKTYELSPKRLGLATGQPEPPHGHPEPVEGWIVVDNLTGELLHHGDGNVSIEVGPTSVRTISYWLALGHPRFVGTNRHLTRGAVDVESLSWDEDALRLSGVSKVVGGDQYKIGIFVPDGYAVKTAGINQKGRMAEVVMDWPSNETVSWQVDFQR